MLLKELRDTVHVPLSVVCCMPFSSIAACLICCPEASYDFLGALELNLIIYLVLYRATFHPKLIRECRMDLQLLQHAFPDFENVAAHNGAAQQ